MYCSALSLQKFTQIIQIWKKNSILQVWELTLYFSQNVLLICLFMNYSFVICDVVWVLPKILTALFHVGSGDLKRDDVSCDTSLTSFPSIAETVTFHRERQGPSNMDQQYEYPKTEGGKIWAFACAQWCQRCIFFKKMSYRSTEMQ